MKRTLILTMVILSIVFTGCSKSVIIKANEASLQQKVEVFINKHPKQFSGLTNKMEKRIIEKSLYNIMYYLKARYGQERFDKFYAMCLENNNFSDNIYKVYNQTFYAIGYRMFKDIDNKLSDRKEKMKKHDIFAFRIHYYEGSQVEVDMPMIEYLLTNYYDVLNKHFINDPKTKTNWQTTLDRLIDKKIHIYLFENKKQTGLTSTAATSIGYGLNRKSQTLVPFASITTAYHNITTSSIFMHEMTHIIGMLSMMDEPLNTITFSNFNINDSKKELYKKVKIVTKSEIKKIEEAHGKFWGEGLAEYTAELYSLYYKYGLRADVDDELRYLSKKGEKFPTINQLLKEGLHSGYNSKELLKRYQLSHSLARYVVKNYGEDKLMELQSNPNDLKKVLGVDSSELYRMWYNDVIEKKK